MEKFLESAVPVYFMALVTIIGVAGTWCAAIYYRKIINQTENMMGTNQQLLLRIKNRFENTYRVNNGVENIPSFVDKQIKSSNILFLNLNNISNAAWKCGIICMIYGSFITLMQLKNDFSQGRIVIFLGTTILFTITDIGFYFLADISGKQEFLNVFLTEYFSNTFSKRMQRVSKEDIALKRNVNKIKATTEEEKIFNIHKDDIDNESSDYNNNFSAKEKLNINITNNEDSDNMQNDWNNRILKTKRIDDDTDTFHNNDFQEKYSNKKNIQDKIKDKENFTEEDIQYLRQSLERIAASKEKENGNKKKHHFSEEEQKAIDDILKEYFV